MSINAYRVSLSDIVVGVQELRLRDKGNPANEAEEFCHPKFNDG